MTETTPHLPASAPTKGAGTPTIPLTTLLIAANIAVFLWMAWKGVSPRQPNVERIRELGANFGPYTLGGQPWRLLTANYIHFGWAHLLTNMICLWGLGRLVEVFYSRRDYLLLYTLSGITGSLLSVYMAPLAVGAGASGAVFGLAGALLATLRWGKLPIPEQARRGIYKQVLEFAGLNLLLGFGLSLFVNIDNYGHMGGLIGGGIAGLCLGRHLDRSPESARFRRIAWLAMLAMVCLTTLGVERTRGYVVDLFAAEQSLNSKKYDAAIAQSSNVIQRRPDLVDPYLISGEAWMAKGDFAKAAGSFGGAADIAPRSPRPLLLMAAAYQLAGDLPKTEVAYRRLVQLAPNDSASHFLLGEVLFEEHKLAEAEASAQQAISLARQPKAPYWTLLGNVHLAANRPADAVADYEQALKLAPENLPALSGMVAAQTALGNRSEAAKYQDTLQKLAQQQQKESEQRPVPSK